MVVEMMIVPSSGWAPSKQVSYGFFVMLAKFSLTGDSLANVNMVNA
jgi:hypothetical protein